MWCGMARVHRRFQRWAFACGTRSASVLVVLSRVLYNAERAQIEDGFPFLQPGCTVVGRFTGSFDAALIEHGSVFFCAMAGVDPVRAAAVRHVLVLQVSRSPAGGVLGS